MSPWVQGVGVPATLGPTPSSGSAQLCDKARGRWPVDCGPCIHLALGCGPGSQNPALVGRAASSAGHNIRAKTQQHPEPGGGRGAGPQVDAHMGFHEWEEGRRRGSWWGRLSFPCSAHPSDGAWVRAAGAGLPPATCRSRLPSCGSVPGWQRPGVGSQPHLPGGPEDRQVPASTSR